MQQSCRPFDGSPLCMSLCWLLFSLRAYYSPSDCSGRCTWVAFFGGYEASFLAQNHVLKMG